MEIKIYPGFTAPVLDVADARKVLLGFTAPALAQPDKSKIRK